MGQDQGPPGPKVEEEGLVLRRIFRIATAATLARAWGQKEPKWLYLTWVLLLFRFIDRRSAKSTARRKNANT